jgi:hypothetical protein
MQVDAYVNELLWCFTDNVEYKTDCKHSDGMSHEMVDMCDIDVENILLSMYDGEPNTQAKPLSKKETMQAKNRACAQRARDADRRFTELMFSELNDITETFDMYSAYIDLLKCHAETVACSRDLELLCLSHKKTIQQLKKHEPCNSMQTLFGMTSKERNRIHAETSRKRKSKLLQDLTHERNACMITLNAVMKYTTALEGSCSVLNNFDETGHAFMELALVRQRLFQRTCTHTQQYETLDSRLSFRMVYASNFR